MGCLNWKPLLTNPRERSWKTLEKAKVSERKNKHRYSPPSGAFQRWSSAMQMTCPPANSAPRTPRDPFICDGGWSKVHGSHPLASPLWYTANYLDGHRGRGQLVINYPEIPETGKAWWGWGRSAARCDSSPPLHWESGETGLVQATVKWQDILVVGSIIICFGNILDVSLLCWAGKEEVFEPLNPVHLALFLLTAVWEGEGNTGA